jgi:hypothetical protein
MNKAVEHMQQYVYDACFREMCQAGEFRFRMPQVSFNESLSGPRYVTGSQPQIEIKTPRDEIQALFWLTPSMAHYFHHLISNGTYDRRHENVIKDEDKVKLEEGVAYTALERIVKRYAEEISSKNGSTKMLLESSARIINDELNPWAVWHLRHDIETGIGHYDLQKSNYDISGKRQENFKRSYAYSGWRKIRETPTEEFKELLKEKDAHERVFKKAEKPLSNAGKALRGAYNGLIYNTAAVGGVALGNAIAMLSKPEIKMDAVSILDTAAPLSSFLWLSKGFRNGNKIEIAEAGSVYLAKTAIDAGRAFGGDVKPLTLDLLVLPIIAGSALIARTARKTAETCSKCEKCPYK